MHRSHPSPTKLRQTATRSRSPRARSIFHLSRRNKTDRQKLPAPRITRTQTRSTKISSSDDVKPFHFPIEPEAVHHQRKRADEGSNRARKIDRCSFDQIDPDTPRARTECKQGRKNNKHDM